MSALPPKADIAERDHDCALRQARELRRISLETLDEIAGLPKGYSSKVLAPHGSRKVTLQRALFTLSRRFLSKIGRKGAQARNAVRMRRKAAARKAALARWHGRVNGGGQ